MQLKIGEKEKAIALRKQGKTYSEILELVPVAKSTLSLWLRDVSLAKRQQQRFGEKRYQAQLKGGQARKYSRIAETNKILTLAEREVGKVTKRELFLIGVALYWAEGSKQSEAYPSNRVCFSNSDPSMVRLFMKWLREFGNVDENDLEVIVHIHVTHKDRLTELQAFWLDVTGLKPQNLSAPIYKKNIPKTVHRTGDTSYKGLVAIRVRRSTILNRRIQGLIKGIIASM